MLVDIDHIPFRVRCPNLSEICYTGDEPNHIHVAPFRDFLFPKRIQLGVYESNLNMGHAIDGIKVTYWEGKKMKSGRGVGNTHLDPWGMSLGPEMLHSKTSYGVADNIQQVLEFYRQFIDDATRQYVIEITPMRKSEQAPRGGWRWHKWGEYIGTQNPQCEYLYDEPLIEEVVVFHIHEVEIPWKSQ